MYKRQALLRWAAPAVVIGLCGLSLTLTARDYFGRYAALPDLARDFYRADWELGRFAAARPPETTLYLSPSQEEMATIYFALGDPDRLRSFNGEAGLIVAGIPGRPALYLIRPAAESTLAGLQAYFPEGTTGAPGDDFIPFELAANAPRMRLANVAVAEFGGVMRLAGYETAREGDNLLVSLAWEASSAPPQDYTAFVHVLDAAGTLIAQTDRPPGGYPTSDWRPGEIVIDRFVVELPAGLAPDAYRLQTGFYDPATVARLGDAAELGEVHLP